MSTSNIQESTLDLEGYRLRVLARLDGPGDPLLIFDGIGASADLLRPLLEGYQGPVILYDQPGVGASQTSPFPERMASRARLAERVLQSQNVSHCHVMGISWGGILAQQFARQYPDKTSSLILAATSSGHLMLPPKFSVMMKMATPLRYLSAGYFTRVAGDIYGGDFRADRQRVEGHARLMAPPSLWGYMSQLYAITGWTSLFWLHRIQSPTLVMAGDDDPIVPLANARLLANRIPNARLAVFDCGHLFVLTRLDAVLEELQAFIRQVPRPASARLTPKD